MMGQRERELFSFQCTPSGLVDNVGFLTSELTLCEKGEIFPEIHTPLSLCSIFIYFFTPILSFSTYICVAASSSSPPSFSSYLLLPLLSPFIKCFSFLTSSVGAARREA